MMSAFPAFRFRRLTLRSATVTAQRAVPTGKSLKMLSNPFHLGGKKDGPLPARLLK